MWDPAGNYLFYMSDREYAPRIGAIEWNYQVDRETGIFALALRKDVKNLFPFESDEVKPEEEAKKEDKADKTRKTRTQTKRKTRRKKSRSRSTSKVLPTAW